ncbi:MAG: PGF-pre-PGF domain-containing protein, partial [Methanosarcinales archaeon]|nr:PGF-pre-PGF domain-containing protein [Methanosarcinales archaeon]
GGGGGGGGSNEPSANIEINQVEYIANVVKDATTDFSFTKPLTPVSGISFYTLMTPSRDVEIRIQQLYNRSMSTTIDAPGTAYKHLNIISSLAAPKEIKDTKVKFKVANEWMTDNGITSSDIVLYRWHNESWNTLAASITGTDSDFTYYVADTPGFSPFEISTVPAPAPAMDISSASVASAQEQEEEVPDGDALDEDNGAAASASGWIGMLILIIMIAAGVGYVYWKEKMEQEDEGG